MDFSLMIFGAAMAIFLAFSALLLVVALISATIDRWRWNGGTCRRNGLPWRTIITPDGTVVLTAGSERARVGRWILSEEYLR